MFIIDDDVLNTLLCTSCEKYLSVLPVKVIGNDKIKCGRCYDKREGGYTILKNIFETGLFKCINRYDGCEKVFRAAEMKQHESLCVGKECICWKCLNRTPSAYEFIQHYKKNHPNSIMSRPRFSFALSANFDESFLHVVGDTIFKILVYYSKTSKKLTLNAFTVGASKPNVTQKFELNNIGYTSESKPCNSTDHIQEETFFNIDLKPLISENQQMISCIVHLFNKEIDVQHSQKPPQKKFQQRRLNRSKAKVPAKADCINNDKVSSENSKKNNEPSKTQISSIHVSMQTLPVEQVPGVQITEQFKEDYPDFSLTPCGRAVFSQNQRFDLVCCKCKNFTGTNCFHCLNEMHVLCWDCKEICPVCKNSGNSLNGDLSSMIELLKFPCKNYLYCKKYCTGRELRGHEKNCM